MAAVKKDIKSAFISLINRQIPESSGGIKKP